MIEYLWFLQWETELEHVLFVIYLDKHEGQK